MLLRFVPMHRNDTGSGLSVEMNRRQMLRGVAAAPVAALALPVEASAASDVEVTVEQGGTEVATVSPVTADRSVEDFYRYDRGDGASANTPLGLEQSDVSRLFFYQPSGGGPLSLVVIHDAPDDGDGGDVRFDFQPGLPGDGSWAVEDDPGERFSRTRADWGWAPCCTDGGAYRGGFDDGFEVTVDPAFSSGIGRWELLDGGGSVAATLSRSDPVTLTVGGAALPDDLGALVDTKLALADRIDANSLGLMNDRERVEPALEGLVDAANADGDPSRATAVEAAKRMVAGERLTDAVLAGSGPGSSPHLSPDTNISRLTAEFAVNPILEILFAGISVLKVLRAIPGLGGLADDAARWLGRFVADVAGAFSETLERLIRNRAREAGLSIFRGVESATKKEGKELTAEEFREIRDEEGTPFIEDSSNVIFRDMLFNEERDFNDNETDPLDVSVAELVEGLDADGGDLDLEGETADALDAAEAQLEATGDIFEDIDSQLSESATALFLQNLGIVEGILLAVAVVAGVLGTTIIGLPVSAIAGAAAALVGIGAGALSLMQWGIGAGGILGLRFRHQIAVGQILDPGGG